MNIDQFSRLQGSDGEAALRFPRTRTHVQSVATGYAP